jgi:glycerol kinase
MKMIETAADINDLAAKEADTGGVFFVTAFSGLLAPYWDPGAAGVLIGWLTKNNIRAVLYTNGCF